MKPRLLFINPVGTIGGAEQVLLSMARQLGQYDVSAVLLSDGPLRDRLAALGVDVRVLELPASAAEFGDSKLRGQSRLTSVATIASSGILGTPGVLKFIRRARTLLRKLQPDLIHSNGLKTHIVTAFAAPTGVPLLWHVHDYYSQRPLIARMLRHFAGGVSQAIAISNDMVRDVGTVLPDVPTTLLYNRVDTERFRPAPASTVDLDQLAGLPPLAASALRVGLVATYAIWKGHDVFLDAIARIPSNLAARFYIVGGPIYSTAGSQWSRADLEARARTLGIADRVGFVSFQTDTAAVYRSLDVMVHASTRAEPFGLTIIEAMSCGTATIVANAGGARELFTDGVDAISHRAGDPDSLATAVTALITDDAMRTSLAANSRATVLERFSEASLGPDLARVYSPYLEKNRCGIRTK